MPKGVEHVDFSAAAKTSPFRARYHLMPKGVEHSTLVANPDQYTVARYHLMPKGVEHL